MLALHPEFVIDDKLNKKAVIVSYLEWEKILNALEEFEDIVSYDRAKNDKDLTISFEQAVKEIETGKLDEV